MTIAALKAALTDAKVSFKSGKNKAYYQELYDTNIANKPKTKAKVGKSKRGEY